MEGTVSELGSELGSALTVAAADRQSNTISGKHMIVIHVRRATHWVLVDGNMS